MICEPTSHEQLAKIIELGYMLPDGEYTESGMDAMIKTGQTTFGFIGIHDAATARDQAIKAEHATTQSEEGMANVN